MTSNKELQHWSYDLPSIINDNPIYLQWISSVSYIFLIDTVFRVISIYPCPVYPESVELTPVSGKTWPQTSHSIEAELTQGMFL